jgi:hypothetical protein
VEASTRYEVEADDGTVFARFALTEDGRDVDFVWGFERGHPRDRADAGRRSARPIGYLSARP